MGDPFLGEVRMMSFNFAPRGWALCDGQLLPINQNQALFSLLGTTYGGNGQTTFALPDLRGRAPIHVNANHPLGQSGGEEAHQLSQSETLQHTHPVRAAAVTAGSPNPAGQLLATATGPIYGPVKNMVNLMPGAVGTVGGGPHQNMQPYLVVNFAISLAGMYPSRN